MWARVSRVPPDPRPKPHRAIVARMASWSRRALPFVIAILACIPFTPALHGGFVDWDDEVNFVTNPAYRGLGWMQLH